MYGIYAYIGVVWVVNVAIYGIHGVSMILPESAVYLTLFTRSFLSQIFPLVRLR